MTIKNDFWFQANQQVIQPFQASQVREKESVKVLSYGCSSYGYDIRLSPKDFRIFHHVPGKVVDPKNFDPNFLESVELHEDSSGQYFILPGHTYGLGVSLEQVTMPPNITAIALGKSTYARVGVLVNVTPIEPMWRGYITLEFSNSSSADCRIYANEGVLQLLFLEGEPCAVTYADRKGKYQNQSEEVTIARV